MTTTAAKGLSDELATLLDILVDSQHALTEGNTTLASTYIENVIRKIQRIEKKVADL